MYDFKFSAWDLPCPFSVTNQTKESKVKQTSMSQYFYRGSALNRKGGNKEWEQDDAYNRKRFILLIYQRFWKAFIIL